MCMTKAAWEQMLFSVDFHLDRQEKQRAACLAARNILEHDISARQKQVLLLYYGEGKKMADIADGAIVGSAIIKLLEKYGKEAPNHIGEYIKSMKDAMR